MLKQAMRQGGGLSSNPVNDEIDPLRALALDTEDPLAGAALQNQAFGGITFTEDVDSAGEDEPTGLSLDAVLGDLTPDVKEEPEDEPEDHEEDVEGEGEEEITDEGDGDPDVPEDLPEPPPEDGGGPTGTPDGGGAPNGGGDGDPSAEGPEDAGGGSDLKAEGGGTDDAKTETGKTDETKVDAGGGGEGQLDGGGQGALSNAGALMTGGNTANGVTTLTLGPVVTPDNVSANIEEETGRKVGEHIAAVESALQQLTSKAASLQGQAVSMALALGGGVQSALAQGRALVLGKLQGARGEIQDAFKNARGTVDGAAAEARGTLEAGEKKARGDIAAAAERNEKLALELYRVQAAAYTALHTELLKPFKDLYEGNATAVRTEGKTIADKYDGLDGAIEAAFQVGSGNPLQQYMAIARSTFAKSKKGTAKKEMETGIEERAVGVEGQVEATSQIVTLLLAPLSQRLEVLGTQGVTLVRNARTQADEKLTSDVATGRKTIDAAQGAAHEQLAADEKASLEQVDGVETQLDGELSLRDQAIRAMFDGAASQFSSDFANFTEQAAGQVPMGAPVTEDAMQGFLSGLDLGLDDLLGKHTLAVMNLRDEAQAQVDAGITASLDGLSRVVSNAVSEAGRVADEKAAVLREVAAGFQTALGQLSVSIDDALKLWTDPISPELAEHEAQVRKELGILLTTSKTEVDTAHTAWKKEKEDAVTNFTTTVAEPANEAARGAEEKVANRAKEAFQAMRGVGTDENKLFDALRAMVPGENGATEYYFETFLAGGESLRSWISDEFYNTFESDDDGYNTAIAHLNLQHAAAAKMEINYNVRWYGDDEAQIEKVLRGLPKEEREKIQNDSSWDATRDLLKDNLDGNDLLVTEALMNNNVAKADAVRLKEKVDEARLKGDNDALADALSGMDQSQIDAIATEFVQLEGVGDDSVPVDANAARQEMAGYVTRDVEVPVPGGHYGETRTLKVEGANNDLMNALIMNGKDSNEAKIAGFEVEMTRPGGPKDERLEKVLLADGDLKERLHSNDPKIKEKAQEELAAQQQSFKEAYTAKYGKDAGESIEALTNVDGGKRDLYQLMLKDGYNSPEVAAKQINLAVEGPQTDEDAIKRALGGMSPTDIEKLKSVYPGDLESDLGVNGKGGFFTELSGQDRMDVEILLLGDPKHMNDDQRFELAEKKHDQQRGSESNGLSRALFGGTYEGEALEANFDKLKEFRNANKSKFVNGKFDGTPQEYDEYRTLCGAVGITADLYQEQVDRVANAVTTTIAVAGAVVAAVATGGAATPLLAAAISGVGSMGVNYALKGGRYGWEDAAKDVAVTGLNMATAGTGAYLSNGPKIAAMSKTGQFWAKSGIAAGQGFITSGGTTAMDDKTWKNGFGSGMESVFYAGGKGALTGFASKGTEELMSLNTTLKSALDSTNGWQRGGAKAFTNFFTGASSKTTELTYDTIGGKYKGDFGDWMKEIGFEAGKNTVQGFFEGAAEASYKRRNPDPVTTTPTDDAEENKLQNQEQQIQKDATEGGEELDQRKANLLDDAVELDNKQKNKVTKEDGEDKVVPTDDGKAEDDALKLADEQQRLVDDQKKLADDLDQQKLQLEQDQQNLQNKKTNGGDEEEVVPPVVKGGGDDEELKKLPPPKLDDGDGDQTIKTSDEVDGDGIKPQDVKPDVVDRLIAIQPDKGAVVEMVLAIKDPVEQLRVLEIMEAYHPLMRKPVTSLSDDEMAVVLKAQYHLTQHANKDFVRKVIPVDAVMKHLQGKFKTLGGSVGDPNNTEGLLPKHMVEVLGLDYNDTAYVTGDKATGFKAVEELFFIDAPMTQDMIDRAKIPMNPKLIEFAKNSTDPEIQALYQKGILAEDTRGYDEHGNKVTSDPFQGNGTTMSSDRLPNGMVRMNQERIISSNPAAGDFGPQYGTGTQIKYRGPDGTDVVVATFIGLPDGASKWEIAPNLPPDLQKVVNDALGVK